MPYKMKKVKGGYKVYSPSGPKSKKPLSKEKARAQQKAIYANAPHESIMRISNGHIDANGGYIAFDLSDGTHDHLMSECANDININQTLVSRTAINIANRATSDLLGEKYDWSVVLMGRKLVLEAGRRIDTVGIAPIPGHGIKGRTSNKYKSVREAWKDCLARLEDADETKALEILTDTYNNLRDDWSRDKVKTLYSYLTRRDNNNEDKLANLRRAVRIVIKNSNTHGGPRRDMESHPLVGLDSEQLSSWYDKNIGDMKEAFQKALEGVQPPEGARYAPKLSKATEDIRNRLTTMLNRLSISFKLPKSKINKNLDTSIHYDDDDWQSMKSSN